MLLSSYLIVWGRAPSRAYPERSRRVRAGRSSADATSLRAAHRRTRNSAILATLLISTGLCALAAPKPSSLRPVHLLQQWIPMADGIRLSATLYMPDGAKPDEKFPALLEYLPYRKFGAGTTRLRASPRLVGQSTLVYGESGNVWNLMGRL